MFINASSFRSMPADIKDGVTVHLVIRAPKNETGAAAAGSTTPSPAGDPQASGNRANAPPPNLGGFPFGQAPGMGNLNFANTNFLDMQQQLQQQVGLVSRHERSSTDRSAVFADHEQSSSTSTTDG